MTLGLAPEGAGSYAHDGTTVVGVPVPGQAHGGSGRGALVRRGLPYGGRVSGDLAGDLGP
jgi:hypothetical protein